jgi:MoxR-like ATPase
VTGGSAGPFDAELQVYASGVFRIGLRLLDGPPSVSRVEATLAINWVSGPRAEPVEQERTYRFPKPSDRFLLHVMVDYPSDADEAKVMRLVRSEEEPAPAVSKPRAPPKRQERSP